MAITSKNSKQINAIKKLEHIRLNPNQLVVEVLTLMSENNLDKLPIYQDDLFIDYISHKELLIFMEDDEEGALHFHKLNFTLTSALHVIKSKRKHSYHRILRFANVAVLTLGLLSIAWLLFSRTIAGTTDLPNMMTISSKKGEYKQVALPDSTKVWLNAESSIEFPETFEGSASRTVWLKGEGYFEVVKDSRHPFIVNTANQEVKVLGTHFNVSAYLNEKITRTTLLEGSIRVKAGADLHKDSVTLQPNQQSVFDEAHELKVLNVNAEDAISWKEGKFVFRNESLENIMFKIARWYDVEVIFKNKQVGRQVFGGEIPKSKNVDDVLKILGFTGDAKFTLDGKTVLVSN